MEIPAKDDLIKEAGDLKVLPFVARKVLEMISSENSSTSELSSLIEKDQTLTSRILKVSNSALYGLRFEVNSVQQAILILGFRVVRSLVLSISTKSLYKHPGITEQILWDHSVGTAISAKLISANFGTNLEEVAFLGGLMHDLGKVVMNNETPKVYTEVMMQTYDEGVDSIIAEENFYGYNHTEIGAGITKKWGFPPALVEIQGKHHLHTCKLEDIEDPLAAKAIACVNLADHVCKLLGIGLRKPDNTIALHELPAAVFLKMTKEGLGDLIKEITKTYNTEKSAFQ